MRPSARTCGLDIGTARTSTAGTCADDRHNQCWGHAAHKEKSKTSPRTGALNISTGVPQHRPRYESHRDALQGRQSGPARTRQAQAHEHAGVRVGGGGRLVVHDPGARRLPRARRQLQPWAQAQQQMGTRRCCHAPRVVHPIRDTPMCTIAGSMPRTRHACRQARQSWRMADHRCDGDKLLSTCMFRIARSSVV